ncbi:hypothetical protein E4U27_001432 [Claviceps purpurea]|nr:hypothetical protein E4U27_001432 [Claviceps purpurea]
MLGDAAACDFMMRLRRQDSGQRKNNRQEAGKVKDRDTTRRHVKYAVVLFQLYSC